MAGVTDRRLRLTTARRPSYFRGGIAIGTTEAPTFIERGDLSIGALLEILQDTNIALAFEMEDGTIAVVEDEERAKFEEGLIELIKLDGPDRTLGFNPDWRRDWDALAAAERAQREPVKLDPAEPQGEGTVPEGSVPDAEASQAGGPDATADGSDASAGDAATTEPTAPESPAAPEPAAEPTPPTSGGRRKAKGTPA